MQVGAADGDRVDADDRVGVVDDGGVGDFLPALLAGSVVDDRMHGSSSTSGRTVRRLEDAYRSYRP
jgi:hypothetical protein